MLDERTPGTYRVKGETEVDSLLITVFAHLKLVWENVYLSKRKETHENPSKGCKKEISAKVGELEESGLCFRNSKNCLEMGVKNINQLWGWGNS
jgi:hypothetical protein